MLFGETQPETIGVGDPIGVVTKNNNNNDAWFSQMMSAAGITEKND